MKEQLAEVVLDYLTAPSDNERAVAFQRLEQQGVWNCAEYLLEEAIESEDWQLRMAALGVLDNRAIVFDDRPVPSVAARVIPRVIALLHEANKAASEGSLQSESSQLLEVLWQLFQSCVDAVGTTKTADEMLDVPTEVLLASIVSHADDQFASLHTWAASWASHSRAISNACARFWEDRVKKLEGTFRASELRMIREWSKCPHIVDAYFELLLRKIIEYAEPVCSVLRLPLTVDPRVWAHIDSHLKRDPDLRDGVPHLPGANRSLFEHQIGSYLIEPGRYLSIDEALFDFSWQFQQLCAAATAVLAHRSEFADYLDGFWRRQRHGNSCLGLFAAIEWLPLQWESQLACYREMLPVLDQVEGDQQFYTLADWVLSSSLTPIRGARVVCILLDTRPNSRLFSRLCQLLGRDVAGACDEKEYSDTLSHVCDGLARWVPTLDPEFNEHDYLLRVLHMLAARDSSISSAKILRSVEFLKQMGAPGALLLEASDRGASGEKKQILTYNTGRDFVDVHATEIGRQLYADFTQFRAINLTGGELIRGLDFYECTADFTGLCHVCEEVVPDLCSINADELLLGAAGTLTQAGFTEASRFRGGKLGLFDLHGLWMDEAKALSEFTGHTLHLGFGEDYQPLDKEAWAALSRFGGRRLTVSGMKMDAKLSEAVFDLFRHLDLIIDFDQM